MTEILNEREFRKQIVVLGNDKQGMTHRGIYIQRIAVARRVNKQTGAGVMMQCTYVQM